jgi:hypothetical protein
MHDVLCSLYSFPTSTATRRAHWGCRFYHRDTLKWWGGFILLSYESAEEAAHRGGRMSKYVPDLRAHGVRRWTEMSQVDKIIMSLAKSGYEWGLDIPDQIIDEHHRVTSMWYFRDEDTAFRFALGV